ncbi:MAG: hypothetical protein ABSA86_02395 [Oryzomonas sp.]|jgi:hypothetical protein
MAIEVQFHIHPEYLLVKMCGEWTTPAMRQALNEIKTEADHQGFKHLLFDMCELSRPDSEMTRFWSGEYVAQVLPPPFKVAVFANPELVNKFGEDTAVNRGAIFKVFSDEQEALRWL